MDKNWSLNELFTDINSKEYKSAIENIETYIEKINLFAKEITANKENVKEKLEKYIDIYSNFYQIVDRVYSYVELRTSANTSDLEALKQLDMIQTKLTKIVAANTILEKWISTIKNLDEIIETSTILKEHNFILKEILQKSKFLLTDKEEEIIASMQNTGSTAWLKYKDKLISNHKVEIEQNGEVKELPLTVVLNMAYDSDKEVRKKAYEAEIASYKKIEDGVAAALNAIKGEVLTVSNLRGYESIIEQTLLKSRMDKESLDAMFEAMDESLPIFRKYLRRKAEILGYKNGLPFYEMYAPVIDSDMSFTYDEASEFIVKNFRTFSDNLADFAKKAIDNAWIDAYPKEGKVGGAFCANLHSIGESRILLNFGETLSDVETFAHELGHGFHGECLKKEATLNSSYPMPIAETASIFCETIIKKAALKQASKKDSLAILESEISGANQVIVDIYSRFLFEKGLFEKRQESALSVEEIKALMIDAQKKAYGDGLDQNYLHPYMWTWKPHYYYAGTSFYNFPYAFGLLFAKGLYAEYIKRGADFTTEYEKLLSVTGKNNIADITKLIGIDIHSKDFWKASLKTVEEDIELFIKLSNEVL